MKRIIAGCVAAALCLSFNPVNAAPIRTGNGYNGIPVVDPEPRDNWILYRYTCHDRQIPDNNRGVCRSDRTQYQSWSWFRLYGRIGNFAHVETMRTYTPNFYLQTLVNKPPRMVNIIYNCVTGEYKVGSADWSPVVPTSDSEFMFNRVCK